MARYFFNLVDGRDIPDAEGTEFSDMAAVRGAALKMAGELLRDGGKEFWSGHEELCGRLGDDGVLKAAYRGGCRSLPEPLSESDTPWRHLPTSSGFVSPRTSTIP
jgi:hypothetical protein